MSEITNEITTSSTNMKTSKEKDIRESCLYKDLIPAKGYYLCMNFTLSCFIPYIYIFLVSIGLSISQAGLVNGIRQIVAGVPSFFIGLLIDYTGRKRIIMLVLIFVNALLVVSTPFVLYPFYHHNNKIMNKTESSLTMTKFNADEKQLFFIVLFWFILLAISRNPLLAIIDSTVVNLVKAYKGKATYGIQRVFGPIGFMLGSILCGLALDFYQPTYGLSQYTIIFILQAPIYILMFICAAVITIVTINYENMDDEENNMNLSEQENISILRVLYQSCKNTSVLVFVITLLISGLSFNIISNCIAIFLKELNATKSLTGATFSISSAAEIIIFPFSSKLINLLGGTYKCICLSIFSYAIRFFIYYVSTSPWHVFAAQLLQAFSFGLFWAASMEYTFSISTNKISQSMFSLVNIIFFMVSAVIANFAGGILYDVIGGRMLFLSMAILCFCWGVVLILFYIFVERHKIEGEKLNANKN